MIGDAAAQSISIDTRKAIDGLAAIVQQHFKLYVFSDSLFLFCGKRCDRIKALLWKEDGFVLLYKRLENGKYKWPRAKGYERSMPVNIGNDVLIGGNVSILGGVSIGDGSIIAAGRFVTKNIASGVIAAGNPAKVIRKITDDDKIFICDNTIKI